MDDNPSRVRAQAAHRRLEQLIDQYRRDGQDRLPPETELSAELGISRNTLREALARLEADGVVIRRRRAGTLISPAWTDDGAPSLPGPLKYPIDEIVTLPEFFAKADRGFEILSVLVTQERATDEVAAALGVPVGTDAYRVRRTYALKGVPLAVSEHVMPKVLRGRDVHIDAFTDGIATFLREVEHITIDLVDHSVTVLAADTVLAKELRLAVGRPLLCADARLHTIDGAETRVVATGRLIFNPVYVHVTASATTRGVGFGEQ